jgi:hypothetical protein
MAIGEESPWSPLGVGENEPADTISGAKESMISMASVR